MKYTYRNIISVTITIMLLTSSLIFFITMDHARASGTPPSVSNPSPSNSSINQSLNPSLSITVSDPEGDELNVMFRSNATDEITRTWYFDNYSYSNWSNHPSYPNSNIIDNNNETCAVSIGQHQKVFILDNNTCNVSDLGIITKVELVARVGGTSEQGDWIIYRLVPIFNGTNGDQYNSTWNYVTGATWISCDITNDSNSPTSWTWADISSLDCEFWDWQHHVVNKMSGKGYRVGIRVTYSWALIGSNTTVTNDTYIQIPTVMNLYNTTYYWLVSIYDGSSWTNETYHFTTQLNLPVVVTNDSTGIEENNATLNGYLQNDAGESCTVRFEYGLTTNYGTNTTNQTKITGDEFSANIGSLTQGQLYHYRAYVNSTLYEDTGDDTVFLTKSIVPTNLIAQTNNSSIIYLTWTKGTGSNNTYIERYSSPNWEQGIGTEIYNGTGTNYEDNGLTDGTSYYYQAWSYINWTYNSTTLGQWSDANISVTNRTHGLPTITNEEPSNGSASSITTPLMNITVNDADGDTMNITWYSNSSGTWQIFGTNTSVGNGTCSQTNNNFSESQATYWWNVTVDDGVYINTSGIFYFSTGGALNVVYVDDDADPGWYNFSQFASLQQGIDAVDAGGTVYVYQGNYTDTPYNISKSISIIGTSPSGIDSGAIIDGGNTGMHIFDTSAVLIDNLTFRNVTEEEIGLITIWDPEGIKVTNSSFELIGSTFHENYEGLFLENATNWSISNCNFRGNEWGDLVLDNTSSGTIENCTFNQSYGIFPGWYYKFNSHLVISNNTFDNPSEWAFSVQSDHTGHNISFHNNTVWNAQCALQYDKLENSWILDNNFYNLTSYAIQITDPRNITVSENNISNCSIGIRVTGSTTTSANIYYNNIYECSNVNGYDEKGQATWDDGISIGNWWEQYDESSEGAWDNDSDAIADDWYNSSGGAQDRYPLMNLWTGSPPIIAPTVLTNISTGVEGTNTTLNGYLQDNGREICTIRFEYGITTNYGTNTSNQTKSTGQTFTANITNLTTGQLYYYRAYANNTAGWSEGNVEMFLTKPETITSFTASAINTTQIDLSWTDGTGGDGAYIEYANGSPPTPWNPGDRTTIDADGNVTTPFSHNGLTVGTKYYYKAWSYATDNGWTSSGNTSAPRGDSPQTTNEITLGTIPIVTTNTSSGIEETNATLWGYLSHNGSVDTQTWFILNNTNDFGNPLINISKGITANQTEIFNDTVGEAALTEGTLYFYKAQANNSGGWREGSVERFLTKPNSISGFTATANSGNQIDLSWTDGTGGDGAYIEYANGSPPTPWNPGDRTTIDADGNVTTPFSHNGLTVGTKYYYKAWSYATDNGWTSSGNNTAPRGDNPQTTDTTTPTTPTVLTNVSTGVEETNATLNGYLQDNGRENCTIRFEYGTTTNYGINTSNQTKSTGQTFTANITNLTRGQLYHYRAYANNTAFESTGLDRTLLTKPSEPSSLNAVAQGTSQITLSWTKGNGTNNTYVMRKTGSYPSNRSDGTLIYNNTGTNCSDTSLSASTTYYYRAWSFSAWDSLNQWSDNYVSITCLTEAGGGGGNPPPSPPMPPDEDEETLTTKEQVEQLFNITLTENFTAADEDGDEINDTFNDPNDILREERFVSINGNASFLISVNGDSDKLFIWDTESNEIIEVGHTIGVVNDTIVDNDNGTVTVSVSINKTGWVYIEIDDQYKRYRDLNVSTQNGRTISEDMIWRNKNRVFVLDDPAVEYIFIFTTKSQSPNFLFDVILELTSDSIYIGESIDALITLINVGDPGLVNATVSYTLYRAEEIIWNESENLSILGQLAFSKPIATESLSPGEYTLSVVHYYGDNQTASAQDTFIVNEKRSGTMFPLWIIVVLIIVIVIIILFLFFRMRGSSTEYDSIDKVRNEIDKKILELEERKW